MLNRLNQSLILTPAIYMPLIWVLFLSSSPMLNLYNIYFLAGWGLLISFGSAYSIALFLSYKK